jgi:PAS domain S-box-containing protein
MMPSPSLRYRVLVVDDNPSIHDDLKKILLPRSGEDALNQDEALLFQERTPVRTRFEIDAAFQGQEGLACLEQALAAQDPYAMAFVDIRMPPGWDGIETIAHLWASDPDLQVVICTAYSDYSWRDIRRRLGDSDNLVILKKPFDNIEVTQLAHTLTAKWLAMHQARIRMHELDILVERRTSDLRAAHESLRAELEQRTAAEAAFRTLFEVSPVAALISDTEGHHLDANRAFEELCGLGRDQIAGRTSAELGLLPSDEAIAGVRQRLARDGRIDALEIVYRHARHGASTGLLWVRQASIGGQPRVLSFLVDISERKLMEVELERSRAAAEDAMQSRSQFLAHMSHEIRTPLNGLLGLSGLLDESRLAAEDREMVLGIRSSGAVLQRVLNNVLDFSKLESGRLELEQVPFDLRESLDQALAIFRQAAAEKDLELALHIDSALPDRFLGDVSRLQQVILNLLSNGIKFTGRGRVELGAEMAGPLSAQGLCPLRLWVADTGIGIPEDRVGHLFQPFTQGDASTNRHYGGTGLGLAICKHIVECMGGAFAVRSRPGEGSTFEIRLELAVAEAPAAPGRVLQEQFSGVRVLVAEDNPVNRMVAVKLLERLGVATDTAADGEQAVERARSGHYDLILMDVQMPGVDGLEATRIIRAQEDPGRRVPIIAFTAQATPEEMKRCLACGMDDFVSKPCGLAAMEGTLRRWARESRIVG